MNKVKWKIGLVLVLLLLILNTASAVQIELVGHDTSSSAHDVAVAGNYAYIVEDDGSICIVNVSNPSEPKLVCFFFKGDDKFLHIKVRGNFAYIGAMEGFYIFDISKPSNQIELIAEKFRSIRIVDVALSGNYAYLIAIDMSFDRNSSLYVVDISNPSNPTKVGECNLIEAGHVFVHGKYAYMTYCVLDGPHCGMYIIDISNPSNPIKVGHILLEAYISNVVVTDDLAYVACYCNNNLLYTVDVSDKSNPIIIDQYSDPYFISPSYLAVSGNYAYVPTAFGLCVFDISQSPPLLIGRYYPHIDFVHFTIYGNYIYAACSNEGLSIFKIDTTPDTAPPTITIDHPQEGQIFTDDTITVSGSASDESGILKSVVIAKGEKVEIKGMNREHWSKSITLSPGINTITITATDGEGNTKTVHRTVTYRNNGDIVVSSEPFGAKIYLDGIYEGTTPKTILDVSKGSHTIELTKDGYHRWSTSAYVTAGDTETISASLNPSSISTSTPNIGDIIVSSEPLGAEVHLDGEYKGVTPKLILDVPVGYHDIDLSMQGYQSGYTHVYVSAGATTKASAFLSPISTSRSTATRAQEDSDGDGVSDKYDYAPSDPNVQSKSDLKTPGFEVLFAIVGLLSAMCMLRRKVRVK